MAALTLHHHHHRHHSCLQASGHLSRRLYHRIFSSFPRNPVKDLNFRLSLADFSSFSLSTRGTVFAVRALSTVAVEESSEKKMVKGIRVYEHGGPEVSKRFDFEVPGRIWIIEIKLDCDCVCFYVLV